MTCLTVVDFSVEISDRWYDLSTSRRGAEGFSPLSRHAEQCVSKRPSGRGNLDL